MVVSARPGERRDVLAIEELRWIADGDSLLETKNGMIEMRFDQNTQRFFLHVSDGLEIDETNAPRHFLGRAQAIFFDLLNKRAEVTAG